MFSLTYPNEQKGYINEIVILDEANELFTYSLSNNLDDIKIAIYARTGYNVDLCGARWRINPNLSISVKHLMNKHQVNFSMTSDINSISKNGFIEINMRSGVL